MLHIILHRQNDRREHWTRLLFWLYISFVPMLQF